MLSLGICEQKSLINFEFWDGMGWDEQLISKMTKHKEKLSKNKVGHFVDYDDAAALSQLLVRLNHIGCVNHE